MLLVAGKSCWWWGWCKHLIYEEDGWSLCHICVAKHQRFVTDFCSRDCGNLACSPHWWSREAFLLRKKERKKEIDCLKGKSVLCCLCVTSVTVMHRRINTKLFFCAVVPTHTLCAHCHCFTHEISEMHRVSAFSLTFHHSVNVENNIQVFCS